MNLPDIKKADLENKHVLMRVDFNVEIEDGKIQEEYRIKSVKETIDFILSKSGVKLALLSHLGRPQGKDEKFSFSKIYQEIGELLEKEIIFVDDCVGEKVKIALDNLGNDQILMLENVRFYKEEEKGDVDFAKKLAENFDIYINESFGVDHRNHASLTKITELLPFFAGLNLQKEVEELGKIQEDFERPAVAIVGGAKIETKLPVIKFFAEKYDWVLVGGKLGLEAEKQNITFPNNVILPEDYKGDGLDIGPRAIRIFDDYIPQANTIVWNGPLGKFEEREFSIGTEKLLEAIRKNRTAHKVAGGGETLQFLEERDALEEFDFVSTGGGAMLEFLVKGTLPALEALEKNF